MLYSILVIVEVVVALSLIALILLQHGKGADAGAAFGSGASGTVFGAKGSANFMSRATAGLATVFFALSLTLAYLVHGASNPSGSVTDKLAPQPAATQSQPASSSGQPSATARPSPPPASNADPGNDESRGITAPPTTDTGGNGSGANSSG